jgi:hypothetical protein
VILFKRLLRPLQRHIVIATLLLGIGHFSLVPEATVYAAEGPSDETRQPVPSAAQIKEAQASISELYKNEFAHVKKSKSLKEKREFANQLKKQAQETADDPTAQYVCLEEARKLLENIGDATGAMGCVDFLAAAFVVDSLALKIESLGDTTGRTPADCNAIVDQALGLGELAHAENRFEKIGPLMQIAQSNATKLKDKKLLKTISEFKQQSAEQRKDFEVFQKASEVLMKTPDDPTANLTTGKYLCLVQGDWQQGGPRLLKGSDPQLKAIAERVIAVPGNVKQMVEVADAWWELAEQDRGSYKTRYQHEARYWYELAASGSTGLNKATIEKRLGQIAGKSPRRALQPGLVEVIYSGTEFNTQLLARIDPKLETNFGDGPAAPGLPVDRFSVIWTGFIEVPVTDNYTLFFNHDDGGRLWIDDKPVFNNWGTGIIPEVAQLQMTAGLHRIKVNYCEGGGTGGINLGWKRTDTERVIRTTLAQSE